LEAFRESRQTMCEQIDEMPGHRIKALQPRTRLRVCVRQILPARFLQIHVRPEFLFDPADQGIDIGHEITS
jgi:hypothetical protein